MPVAVTYPGVYVEELPSGVHTIVGVATSIAAFVGRAWSGPVDSATTIYSYADYARIFGGLWRDSTMSYAVQQFFQNGGAQAIIVRVATRSGGSAAAAATYTIGGVVFEAAWPGSWGSNLVLTIDHNTKDTSDVSLFNLTIVDGTNPDGSKVLSDAMKRGGSGMRETFYNVSADPSDPRFVATILEQQSQLLRVQSGLPTASPYTAPAAGNAGGSYGAPTANGSDGTTIGATEVSAPANATAGTGLWALDQADIFNLLVIPPFTSSTTDNGSATWAAAAQYCHDHRAVLLVDAPSDWNPANTLDPSTLGAGAYASYAAVYFPRLLAPDENGNLQAYAPAGSVAGVFARTDVARGVWKAPAGTQASLQGTSGFQINGQQANLTDSLIGALNPLGINCLRNLPILGPVVWGARTLDGADIKSSDWKYVPVRRLALYIEESLFRSLSWVVFEPNDEPLWSSIRLDVGAFMQGLFRQGAFQGQAAKDAYFVKCDKDTTTQNDINLGVVNIVVGFAPVKPAEFVVIQIQQMAGQIQT
ncbi:MAG TPA: phage tail sheath C-terminal domain-containing protein [Rhizomicrobium sp.]|jgi:hypothetical protein